MTKLSELFTANTTQNRNNSWTLRLILSALAVVLLALLVIQLDTFETVSYPIHEYGKPMIITARKNAASFSGLEKIGLGQLPGPEDMTYDRKSGVLYTGCIDGWIRRVKLNDSVAHLAVQNWVHTGGRPLGIDIAESGDVFVADTYKGLLKVSQDGEVEVLTNEAEGVKFGLTDDVVVAKNGMVYFTDATYKYPLHDSLYDVLEGRPHGRLLSYDPSTKQTKVLKQDIYFANGVELSPDQDFVIFCETLMLRCLRYYVAGEKVGSVDVFAENLPGFPDNIQYDGDGHYWIATPWDNSFVWKYAQKYRFVRKIFAFMLKHLKTMPELVNFGGVIALDFEGKPIGGYYDDTWRMISSGFRIGEHLYMGSITNSHILRFNLTEHPVTAATNA